MTLSLKKGGDVDILKGLESEEFLVHEQMQLLPDTEASSEAC